MDEDTDFDYMSAIMDEIALEGLDGITLPSLWKRLDKRPKFPFPIDGDSKNFIWRCISPDENIEFFGLPEPRVPLVIFNRYQNMDMEFGIVIEHEEEIPDPYPYCPVEDKAVKGSCSNYKTRVNVTKLVREKGVTLMTLQDLLLKWPREQFILVASQPKRNIALLGSEISPSTSFGLIQYCLLERIARSRHHGEVTCGKNSLACLNLPPKTLFYYRKRLLAHKIIVKQFHYQKPKEGQLVKGSLLQLARFYVERLSKMEILIMKMCKALENKPNKQEEYLILRDELELKPTMFKKMFGKIFQTCVKVKVVPSSEHYPDKPKDEHYTNSGKEKLVKVVELVKPYDDYEDDDGDDEDEKVVEDDKQVHFCPSKFSVDRTLLCQTLKTIDDAGPDGATSVSIGKKMGLPKLEIRTLVRVLERKGVVITVMQDSGRQRSLQYISKRFEDESKAHKQVMEMQRKLMNFTTTVDEDSEMPVITEHAEYEDLNNKGNLDITVESLPEEGPAKPSKSWSFSLKDINNINKKLNVPSFTYRMLKRANRIIELVNEYKLFDQLHKIQKIMIDEEAEEGVVEKLDRASTSRIIHRLSKDGYIQSIKTVLKFGNKSRKLHFICDRSITSDDPLLKRAIDEAKLKYMSNIGNSESKEKDNKHEDKDNDSLLHLSKPESDLAFEYCPGQGKLYGFQPKCIRMKTLHELLCYLVYFYEGNLTTEPSDDTGKPPVYLNTTDWRKYLPPLPKRSDLPEGQIYFADLLHSLPLALLVIMVNYTFKIPGIDEFLNDEDKRFYLIQHFPTDIRNGLLYHRKHVHSIHELMVKLSFNGLVTFVVQRMKEKEKSLIYIHRKTVVKDTTISNPGYMHISQKEYPELKYDFQTMTTVNDYWTEVERISLNTPLGSYNESKEQTITIFNVFHKPEMEEAMKPKEINDIVDDFKVPGDVSGAGGFDSAMYFHLKRNWYWPSITVKTNRTVAKKKTQPSNIVGNCYISYLNSNEDSIATGGRKRLGKFIKKPTLEPVATSVPEVNKPPGKLPPVAPTTVGEEQKTARKRPLLSDKDVTSIGAGNKKRKVKPVVRVVQRKPKKARKPYYDEADKKAITKMTKLRVTWTAEEDSFLLLCKVASCFLDPYYKMVVPYAFVRDLIHQHLPHLSINKSSRACQRRILYMLKNPVTVTNVSVYLGEANQDGELVRQFQGPKPNKNQEDVWKSMFAEVLSYLLKKFTSGTIESTEKITLPDSVEEFKRKFNISESGSLRIKKNIHVTPKNVVDIHCSVVFSMVLQSLSSMGDKSNWNQTLYKMIQYYPDTLVRSAQAKLRHEGIITKRKDCKKPQANLPVSTQHRLSNKFENILQGRYQEDLFSNAHNFFIALLNSYNQCEEDTVLEAGAGGSEMSALASLTALRRAKFEINVPEQIIIFDSKITEEFKQKIAEKTQKFTKDDETDGDDSSKLAVEVPNPSRASRFALYMMRHDLNEPLQEFQNVQHAHDSFLINSCTLNVSLLTSDEKERDLKVESLLPIDLREIQNVISSQRSLISTEDTGIFTDSDIENAYSVDGYHKEISEIGAKIYKFILQRKEIGCTLGDLLHFESELQDVVPTLLDHLNILLGNEIILRVGVTQYHYVSHAYANPWILNSVKIPKDFRSLGACMSSSVPAINSSDIDIANSEALEALREGVDHGKNEPAVEEPKAKKPRLDEANEIPHELIRSWFSDSVLDKISTNSNTVDPENQNIQVPTNANITESEKQDTQVSTNANGDTQVFTNVNIAEPKNQNIHVSTNANITEPENHNIQVSTNANITEPENLNIQTEIIEQPMEITTDHISTKQPEIKTENLQTEMLEMSIDTVGEIPPKELDESQNGQTEISISTTAAREIPKKEPKSQNIQTDNLELPEKVTNDVIPPKSSTGAMEESEILKWLEENILNQVDAKVQAASSMDESQNQPISVKTEESEADQIENPMKQELKEHVSLKSWLEAKVTREVEALHQTANKSADDNSSVAEINRWLQESIVKKLEDKCSVEDIKLWFKKCILEKVENQSAIMDLQQWFQDSILKTLEDQTFLDDLELMRQAELERKMEIEMAQEAKTKTEASVPAFEKGLRQWLQESVLDKLDEIQVVSLTCKESAVMPTKSTLSPDENDFTIEDLSVWFKNSILKKVEERVSLEELDLWLKNVVLQKVVDESQAAELRNWFENSLLKKIEEKVEAEEFKTWFEDTFSAVFHLQNLETKAPEKRSSISKDLKDWFEKTILELVESEENLKEINEWFDNKVLGIVESCCQIIPMSNKPNDLNLEQLKHWLNVKVISKLSAFEHVKELLEGTLLPEVVELADLRKWLEDEVLSIIEEMDHEVSTSDTSVFELSEITQWLDYQVSNLTDALDDTDVKSWFETNILKVIEDDSIVRHTVTEATISVLTCIKDVISKVEETELKTLTKYDFKNVLSCVKDIISDVEKREKRSLNKREMQQWFETRIYAELENFFQVSPPSTEIRIDKEIVDFLETEVLNKIENQLSVESNAESNTNNTKMVTRKQRRKTLTEDTSSTLVPSTKNPNYEPIKYISRIWKKPDGNLNRPVLRKMLTSVLSHIMSNPGINETDIFEKFEMCLQPVQILDLLEILKKLNCVESICLKSSCRSGIFSKGIIYQESTSATDYTNSKVFYEATVHAILSLGKFIDELIISH